MDHDFGRDEDVRRPRSTVGPIVLVLPLAFLILGISFLKDASHAPLGPRAVPPAPSKDTTIAGWEGELEVAPGVRVRATLGPLHSDAGRQEFERRALARRLGLGDGAPYRLVLDVDSGALTELAGALRIVDGSGEALRPLVAGEADGGALADPLRVLLGPPDLPSTAASEARQLTWFLWGRAPEAGARLEGLTGSALALTPKPIPRSRVDVALLRTPTKENR